MTTYEALLETLCAADASGTPISERDVARAIRPHLKQADTETPDHRVEGEFVAFNLREACDDRTGASPSYYGPMAIWPDGAGRMVAVPSLEQVTSGMVMYWAERSVAVTHPVLKCRYADLAWECAGRTGVKRNGVHARTAIVATVEIADRKLHPMPLSVINKLRRALSLAISISDGDLIERVAVAMAAYETAVAQDGKPGLWGFAFDALVDNKRLSHLPEIQVDLVAEMEARLSRVIVAQAGPTVVRSAAGRLATYYRRHGNVSKVDDLLKSVEAAYRADFNSDIPLQVSSGLQSIHALYVSFGMGEQATRIAAEIISHGPAVRESLSPFSASVEITGTERANFLAQFAVPIADCVQRIVSSFLPHRGDAVKQLDEIAQAEPLAFWFSTTLLDHRGRPYAEIGSLQDDHDGNVIRQATQMMHLTSPFLRWSVEVLVANPEFTVDWLTARLADTTLFSVARGSLLRDGLNAMFAQKWAVAIHLLIPEVEAGVRMLAERVGVSPIKPTRNGGFDFRTLDDLLRDEGLRAVLKDDIVFYLRILLTERRGWNIRNTVCHGLCRAEDLNSAVADRILHVFLLLSFIRPRTDPESGSAA